MSALGLAILALFLRALLEPSMREGRIVFLEYSFVLLTAYGLLRISENHTIRIRAKAFLGHRWLVLILAVLLAAWSYKLGMYQFGGYDEGFLANLAYHYLRGYRPVTDYPTTMPPLFMAGIRAVVLFLPFRWASLVLFSSLFCLTTTLWLYALLTMLRVPSHWVLLVTAAIEFSTMFVLPFWWYNNITSVSILLLIFSIACCLRQGQRFLPWLSLAVSLGMTLDAKPNVALLWLSPCVLLLTRDRRQWLRTGIACLGAASISFLICKLAEVPPSGILRSYREVSGSRGNPLLGYAFRQFEAMEALIVACLSAFILICFFGLLAKSIDTLPKPHRSRPLLIVSLLAALTAFEMTCTNGELKNVDLIVLYGAVVLLVLCSPLDSPSDPGAKSVLVSLTILFVVWSSTWGILHLRILGIGEEKFYQPLPTQRIHGGFLAGLDAGPRLIQVQQEVSEVLARYPAEKVFFGPRLEFEAAVFRRELLPGLPIQWEPGSQYPASKTPVLLENFKRQDPDLLIFLKRDFTRMYSVGDYIRAAPIYRADLSRYPDLEIYIRQRKAGVESK